MNSSTEQVNLCSYVGPQKGTQGRGPQLRQWYVRYGATVLFSGDESIDRCEQWLAYNGYTVNGTMPPDCFEYTRQEQEKRPWISLKTP